MFISYVFFYFEVGQPLKESVATVDEDMLREIGSGGNKNDNISSQDTATLLPAPDTIIDADEQVAQHNTGQYAEEDDITAGPTPMPMCPPPNVTYNGSLLSSGEVSMDAWKLVKLIVD